MKECKRGSLIACTNNRRSDDNHAKCVYCEHFQETKMDFFEAWKRADIGDKILSDSSGNSVIKDPNDHLRWLNSKSTTFTQRVLFLKQWSIIPRKVTNTIVIPEGAENIRLEHQRLSFGPGTKINYDIEE